MPARLGDRSLFPELEADVYLSHAAISPPSELVARAARQAVEQYARRGLAAWIELRDQRDRLRGKLAELVGAGADELALVANTTTGVQAVAFSTPWRAGERILCFEGEFPTNVSPWQVAAREWDLRLEMLPLAPFHRGADEGLEALRTALRGGSVRLVAVSLVQFQTGLRMPVEAMAELCHQHGAELFVDGIQGVGAQDCSQLLQHVDAVSVGSHKWLMGLEGAGFLAVRRSCWQRWVPRLAGWLSHEDGVRFLFEGEGHLRYDRPLRQSPDFLESGAANAVGFAALEAAIEPLRELGPATIHRHLQEYHDRLEPGLIERGFTSLRSREPEGCSGILALRPPSGRSAADWVQALGEQGIACTQPDGHLRLAPHWPNDLDEVPRVLEAVDRIRSA